VKAGDLLAIGDNTGFTTGPHCHTQWRGEVDRALPGPAGVPTYRLLNGEVWLQDADTNEANNSFDPTLFFNGKYAVDISTSASIAAIKDQATALARAVADIKSTDPDQPQEETLANKIIALIEEEIAAL
jgi:murein DD-endopeptidase MepM/ murein hydrolase activator NlpD